MTTLRVGTRGSALALVQARLVADALQARDPSLSTEIVPIRTTGDMRAEARLEDLGGKGAFTLEIERALLDGSIDLAVHSMKDLPPTSAEGLATLPVLARESPWDALVAPASVDLDAAPRGFRVGTSSPRRRAQLLARWPQLAVVDMRGNVPTRIEKLLRGDFDAIVLAEAGLSRLGLEPPWSRRLSPTEMLPAPHQGILALQCRPGGDVHGLAQSLVDPGTMACWRAEREVARALGASCHSALAALAQIGADGVLRLSVRLATGGALREATGQGLPVDAVTIGQETAQRA